MVRPYLGEIRIFGGKTVPTGWVGCNGQELAIKENEKLYDLIGTTYGGDGLDTFALPGLTGKSLMHKGNGQEIGDSGVVGFEMEAEDYLYGAGRSIVESVTTIRTNFIISLDGQFPSRETCSSEPLLAQLKMFAFDFAPKGWVECDGQRLPINQNQALFSILGTMYGGDGQTDLALPDLRGMIPIHQAESRGAWGALSVGQSIDRGHVLAKGVQTNKVSFTFCVVNFCIALQGVFPPRD